MRTGNATMESLVHMASEHNVSYLILNDNRLKMNSLSNEI